MAADLRGRRAIVTGGGRSIGRALALGLARSGADVAIVYRERSDAAEATAAEARAHNVRAFAVQADTADEAQVQRMVEQVVREFVGVEILVNNAGVQSRIPFVKLPYQEWRRVIGTNLDGYFLVSQAVARQMVEAGRGGAIVNVTSTGQDAVAPNMTHYNVSKAGALKLTHQMAYELAPHGIRVNALAPGLTETDINREDLKDEAFRSGRLSRIPLGFIGTPEDQVGALLYLVSDDARYVTGECIRVGGGAVLMGPAGLMPKG
jgi:NAD(P)-dependent dehydrogenase (short-subunit alcohol dehydrogenase family)